MYSLGLQRLPDAYTGKSQYLAMHGKSHSCLGWRLPEAVQSADLAEALESVDSISKALMDFIAEFDQPQIRDQDTSML